MYVYGITLRNSEGKFQKFRGKDRIKFQNSGKKVRISEYFFSLKGFLTFNSENSKKKKKLFQRCLLEQRRNIQNVNKMWSKWSQYTDAGQLFPLHDPINTVDSSDLTLNLLYMWLSINLLHCRKCVGASKVYASICSRYLLYPPSHQREYVWTLWNKQQKSTWIPSDFMQETKSFDSKINTEARGFNPILSH